VAGSVESKTVVASPLLASLLSLMASICPGLANDEFKPVDHSVHPLRKTSLVSASDGNSDRPDENRKRDSPEVEPPGEPSTNSTESTRAAGPFDSEAVNQLYTVDKDFASSMLKSVDEKVRKNFYSEKVATQLWPEILSRHQQAILSSTNLGELSNRMNAALSELKVSHTQFVTINDEHFYFLRNLFDSFKPDHEKANTPIGEYIGLGLGGTGFAANQIRYVVDGSPAAIARLKRGDLLLQVNDNPYLGLLSFSGLADKKTRLSIRRGREALKVEITPRRKNYYDEYLEASTKSIGIFKTATGPVGYMHLWCGGKAGELLSDAMESTLSGTKAMILDLRDGYGGNSLQDLDVFYRLPIAYPVFNTYGRKGKQTTKLTYSGKLVTLINGGSRSGKELLAFSLKCSKRGRLVGERTAGAVLAGRVYPLNDRCALYLAVMDGTIGGRRLEGIGVEPDIRVTYPPGATNDSQLQAAFAELNKKSAQTTSSRSRR
jgi:carboxyl-terminal processing protease